MPSYNSVKIVIYAHASCQWDPSRGPLEVSGIENVYILDPSDTPILKFYLTAESADTPVFGIRWALAYVKPFMDPNQLQQGDVVHIAGDYARAPVTISWFDRMVPGHPGQGRIPIRIPRFSYPLSFEMRESAKGVPMEMTLAHDRLVRLTATAVPVRGESWSLAVMFEPAYISLGTHR